MDKLNLKSKFDIFAGFAILGIVLMIIIPLPPFALDILLSVNIALSVLILLLTAIYVPYNIACYNII